MTPNKNISYIKSTLKLCIAGLFIPGFTAIAIFGLKIGIGFLGIECSTSWIILWTLTAIGSVIAPFVFTRQMNKPMSQGYYLGSDRLIIFNIIEYTLLQATFAAFFTNGQTLCYVSDGQNGLEFVFTGWMALPVLLALSFLFDNLKD